MWKHFPCTKHKLTALLLFHPKWLEWNLIRHNFSNLGTFPAPLQTMIEKNKIMVLWSIWTLIFVSEGEGGMPGCHMQLVPAQESKRWSFGRLLLLPVIQKGLFLGPKKSRKIRHANTGLPVSLHVWSDHQSHWWSHPFLVLSVTESCWNCEADFHFHKSLREPRFVLVPRAGLGKPWSADRPQQRKKDKPWSASNANKPASSWSLNRGPKKVNMAKEPWQSAILFGTRKTLQIWFFVSRMVPLTPSRPTKPWTKPWQENREKEEQETEVRCWLGLHQTVKSVLRSLSMLGKCSNVCVIDVDSTNVSSQVQITSPTFSNHKFKHTFKKMTKLWM